MQYKLLSVSQSDKLNKVNIGDYIQALASLQYYPHLDGFIDRDTELKKYDGEPCKMIMNGWYMHDPQNWPPSDKIEPLFVAFHLNILAKKELTAPESITYLKKHEPIGCRDLKTLNLLREFGVEAYFSGCMTLTLGKNFSTHDKEDKTYIVDPILKMDISVKQAFLSVLQFITHPLDIIKLLRNNSFNLYKGKNKIKKLIVAARFYKIYTKIFAPELIVNSIYICQDHRYYKEDLKTDMDRLHMAEHLVRQYSKAKIVVTSRIHCALPCLGLGTPVIFLKKTNDAPASACRLDGLTDLFNIVEVDSDVLTPLFETSLPISKSNYPNNKDCWKPLAQRLDKICSEFI